MTENKQGKSCENCISFIGKDTQCSDTKCRYPMTRFKPKPTPQPEQKIGDKIEVRCPVCNGNPNVMCGCVNGIIQATPIKPLLTKAQARELITKAFNEFNEMYIKPARNFGLNTFVNVIKKAITKAFGGE